MPPKAPVAPQSERGRRQRQEVVLSPLAQIRVPGGGPNIDAIGAYAYYLNPNGATISDALILYPNGGVPDVDNPQLKSRYGENSEYYRARQRQKGLEYIGQSLTEGGIRRLIEVLEANRPDEILFMEDEIRDASEVSRTSDRPEIRDQAKRRIRQLNSRLNYLKQDLDPDALETELKEIARAQQLAKVDPAVLRVMRSMIGEVNDRLIAHFQGGGGGDGAPSSMSRAGSDQGLS